MYVLVIIHSDGEQKYVGPFVNKSFADTYASKYLTEQKIEFNSDMVKFEIHPIIIPVNGR